MINKKILDNYYQFLSHFPISLDTSFSFVLYFLWLLSLEDQFLLSCEVCPVSGIMLSMRWSFVIHGPALNLNTYINYLQSITKLYGGWYADSETKMVETENMNLISVLKLGEET